MPERVEIGELAENIVHLREAHEQIHKHADVIPNSVHVICLTAYGDTEESIDELISPLEALDVIVSLGHGTLVVDTTQRPVPETGKLSHELEFLKTDELSKMLDPDWKPTKQIVRLDEHTHSHLTYSEQKFNENSITLKSTETNLSRDILLPRKLE